MAQTVQLACARCGHQQMYVVESIENDEPVAEIVRKDSREVDNAVAMRLRRLESLPKSLPVGVMIPPPIGVGVASRVLR